MNSANTPTLNIDFSVYRSGGVANPDRPEEEKGLQAMQLAESLRLDLTACAAIEEASTAIGCARYLGELLESDTNFSADYSQAGLIHMRLQGHKVEEAYKTLMEIEIIPPDLLVLVTRIRKGLNILLSIISHTIEKDNCNCEICLIGKSLKMDM